MKTGTLIILAALLSGCATIERIDRQIARWRGEPTPEPIAPTPGLPATISGDTSGLVKPVSESDGRLVILLPRQYRWPSGDRWAGHADAIVMSRVYLRGTREGDVAARQVYLPSGEVNDNRIHARFPAPGSAYGGGELVLELRGGGEKAWPIANFGARSSFR